MMQNVHGSGFMRVRRAIGGLALTSLMGCGLGADSPGPPAGESGSAGLPRTFPASALRLDGPKDLVLAEGEHGIELTLAEYNARSEDFPLPAELDTLEARKQLLELLVDHKVVAAEGRLRGYGARDASNLREEEDALVQQMIRSNVREAQSINDAEARQFFESRIEEFSGLTPDDLGDPATLLHVKFTMNDLRWRSLKVKWRQREAVVVHEDRFAALQAAASESFLYSNEESR